MTQIARALVLIVLVSAQLSCGGGGSSRASTPEAPAPSAQRLEIADAIPAPSASLVDPAFLDVSVSHFAFADLAMSLSGSCPDGVTLRRPLIDLGESTFDEIVDHKLRCASLGENSTVEIVVGGERNDGSLYETDLSFATATSASTDVAVLDSLVSPAATVESAFTDYLTAALLPELDLPAALEAAILVSAEEIFGSWTALVEPDAQFGVTTQRVSYLSRDPQGNATTATTGLVAMPEISGSFSPRDRVIVLMHSTGSTPGDLDATNGWYLFATLLASRGYLVVAADNWGRGGTGTEAETYLLANRTAANTLDLLTGVLGDDTYEPFFTTGTPVEIAVVGYSQGGHSALAVWQTLATQGPDEIAVREVYAGGGPYDLYRTFRGVLEHLNGSCDTDSYCRYVDSETTLPFATDRILPGFVEYAGIDLSLGELVEGDALSESLVTGFLGGAQQFDALKARLQHNSFVNLRNLEDLRTDPASSFRIYHSEFDRLVPEMNAQALVSHFTTDFEMDYRTDVCDGAPYEAIFGATERVGIVHALCGLSMLNDVLSELR